MTKWLVLAFVDLNPSTVFYLGWNSNYGGRKGGMIVLIS